MTSHIQDTQRKQLLARLRDAVLRAGVRRDWAPIRLDDLDAAIVLVEIAIEGSPTEIEAIRRADRMDREIEDLKAERDEQNDRAVRAEDALAEAQSDLRAMMASKGGAK